MESVNHLSHVGASGAPRFEWPARPLPHSLLLSHARPEGRPYSRSLVLKATPPHTTRRAQHNAGERFLLPTKAEQSGWLVPGGCRGAGGRG